MATPDKKKYKRMENILQYINKNFVTVSEEDSKRVNPILKYIIELIITTMKKVNPLFKALYESILYGGSFYDGLKVGKPEEFDIDLKLVLPKSLSPELSLSNQPGFVVIQLTGWSIFEKSSEYPKYKGLEAFKDENDYLLVNKVLQWMESTVNLAMNEIGKNGNKTTILYNDKYAEITLKKSGPALTALITYDNIHMDVDLVAVFKFTSDNWPPNPFRALPNECSGKTEFLIVPKTPKIAMDKKERCWRMSFHEQEKVLITGNNTCKPALRLIKKLRDTQNHNMISSYFIKTVFLHEIDKSDKQFWNASLSYVFMHMLKTYRDCLSNYNIPYYWNQNNNLLQHIDKTTVDNFKNYLSKVIDSVDKKIDENCYVIADFLCTPNEYKQLQVNFIPTKTKSNEQDVTDSCVTENPSVDAVTKTLNSCNLNVDVINTPVDTTKEIIKPNDVLLTTLFDIQQSFNILQFDVKSALNKINNIEKSEEDIKNILVNKSESSNIKSLQDCENLIMPTLMDLKESVKDLHTDIKISLNKMNSLQQSVEELQDDNKYFKKVLKNLTEENKSIDIVF